MKTIRSKCGHEILVSDRDYGKLKDHTWYIRHGHAGVKYAFRNRKRDSGWTTIRMHREILGAIDGLMVDHRDGNGLNNQRSNLRLCTNTENCMNRKKRRDGRSPYKGVWKRRDKWVAYIKVRGKNKSCGTYRTEWEAAQAYNRMATRYFGKFARLNKLISRLDGQGAEKPAASEPEGQCGRDMAACRCQCGCARDADHPEATMCKWCVIHCP